MEEQIGGQGRDGDQKEKEYSGDDGGGEGGGEKRLVGCKRSWLGASSQERMH